MEKENYGVIPLMFSIYLSIIEMEMTTRDRKKKTSTASTSA